MNIAVLYTGSLRTFEKTIKYFVKNILLSTDVHVYACVQSDNKQKDELIIVSNFGQYLKDIIWFDPADPIWSGLQNHLINTSGISNWPKEYLLKSGSMIEYYQLYLAYTLMVKNENKQRLSYDYVIRCRPDFIISHPIDFSWLLPISNEVLEEKLHALMCVSKKMMYHPDNITCLMNSLIDPDRLAGANDAQGVSDILINEYHSNYSWEDDIKTMDDLQHFIKYGQYIITLRKNEIYVVNRRLIHNIALLGISYGLINIIGDQYWWDAESQLQSTCIHNNIIIFDSCTKKENDSLYKYDPSNYFDQKGELIKGNYVFFICRS